jgi:hypothetical protein
LAAETLRQLAATHGHAVVVALLEQVALIPQCIECLDVWLPIDDERWRAYLDTASEVVFYCPDCAEREFGPD